MSLAVMSSRIPVKTMRAYLFSPDESWEQQNPYRINARRNCALPGLVCQGCGQTWASTGVVYPATDCEKLRAFPQLTSFNPLPASEHVSLQTAIRAETGLESPLPPGTEFGPLQGSVSGKLGDFVWLNPWVPLLWSETVTALSRRGLSVAAIEARLKLPKPYKATLAELELYSAAKLAPESRRVAVEAECPVCGRLAVKLPPTLVLDRESFELGGVLQRVAEIPTILVASEAFVAVVKSLGLRGAAFAEVALA